MKKFNIVLAFTLFFATTALFVLPSQSEATINTTFNIDIAKDQTYPAEASFQIIVEASPNTTGEVVLTSLLDKSYAHEISIPNTVTNEGLTYRVVRIGKTAFYEAANLKNTGLANNTSITSIEKSAYSRCKSLLTTELEYNNTITTIGQYAFYQDSALTSTGLQNNTSVTIVEADAFRSTAISETGLAYNNTVSFLGEFAFMDCLNLTSTGLETNTSVTTIERGLFLDCINITQSSLAANTKITSIPTATFTSRNLTTFIFKGVTLPVVQKDAFIGTTLYYLDTSINKEALNNYTTIVPYKLQGMRIQQMPFKTQYVENQTFNPEGLILSEDFTTLDDVYLFHDEIDLPHLLANGATFNKSKLTLQDHDVIVSYLGQNLAIPIQVSKAPVTNPPTNPDTPSQPDTPPVENPDISHSPTLPTQNGMDTTITTSPIINYPPNTADTSNQNIWIQLISVGALVAMVIILKKKQK